jgi:hypothetical protein
MKRGVELAKAGHKVRRRREADAQRDQPVARAEQLRRSGEDLSALNTGRWRDRRERRARQLGYASIDDYLRRRYVLDGAPDRRPLLRARHGLQARSGAPEARGHSRPSRLA